ncbi:hypothetical protein GQ44DRAFT_772635 [Phaeosphaeriaceae sp. PMI808]|nr:hypothetical protein GQ44DRAFT_772635 [Phaeosphaeriaceae sp. PMI808]
MRTARYTCYSTIDLADEVSWQSLFWPIIACALAVILQNTGKTCSGQYNISYILRSSPFICLLDTVMMLVKFISMLVVGCSFPVAARHVWYDRFTNVESAQNHCYGKLLEYLFDSPIKTITEPHNNGSFDDAISVPHRNTNPSTPLGLINELSQVPSYRDMDCERLENISHPRVFEQDLILYPGSDIDRTWRLSMASFIFGALPQAIKIFGMKKIPGTQAFVTFLLVTFLLPEMFRLVAGRAGAYDLHPMPIIVNSKDFLSELEVMLVDGVVFSTIMINILWLSFAFHLSLSSPVGHMVAVFHASILISVVSTTGVIIVLRYFPRVEAGISLARREPLIKITKRWEQSRPKILTSIVNIFALEKDFINPFLDLVILTMGIFFIVLTISSYLMMKHLSYSGKHMFLLLAAAAMGSLLRSFLLILVLYGVYRVTFMGSLSKWPRRIFGLSGSIREFNSGIFISSTLTGYLVFYASFYEPYGTHKPAWTDNLG